MKKKTITFCYRKIILGGAEQLIFRMSKWYYKNNYNVNVICETISNNMLEQFEKENIEIIIHSPWKKKIQNVIHDKSIIYTFFWSDFRLFECKQKYNCKVLLYIVHPDNLKLARRNIPLINPIRRYINSKVIEKKIKSHQLFFMDNDTIENTEKFYNKTFFKNKFTIHLPIEIPNVPIINLEQRSLIDGLKILTIARADFDFKGYLIGLVKLYKYFREQNKSMELTIVSYGTDIEVLMNEIDNLPSDLKKDVHLMGETPYEELNELYNTHNLYIGMGTTILDASKHGLISIAVQPYTFEIKGNSYFHDNPEDVVCKNEKENKILELVENILSITSSEYFSMERKCIEKINEEYSIDEIMNKLNKYVL